MWDHAAITACPPGFSARRISLRAANRSGKNCRPCWHTTKSNAALSTLKGAAGDSTVGKSDVEMEPGKFPASEIAERTIWNLGACESVRLDVGRADHPAPLLGFCGDEISKVSGRTGNRRVAEIGKLRLDLAIGQGDVDFPVELFDDLCGSLAGRTDPLPAGRLVARHKCPDGRDIGQRLRTSRGGHREGAQLAGSDEFDRRGHGGERHLHLSAEQVIQCACSRDRNALSM